MTAWATVFITSLIPNLPYNYLFFKSFKWNKLTYPTQTADTEHRRNNKWQHKAWWPLHGTRGGQHLNHRSSWWGAGALERDLPALHGKLGLKNARLFVELMPRLKELSHPVCNEEIKILLNCSICYFMSSFSCLIRTY